MTKCCREAKSVVYYMHRDQRVQDNWALVYAQTIANKHNLPLSVVAMISAKHPKDTGMDQLSKPRPDGQNPDFEICVKRQRLNRNLRS